MKKIFLLIFLCFLLTACKDKSDIKFEKADIETLEESSEASLEKVCLRLPL